ncbi:hypothetical protein BH23CHL5_BH23CHL5_27730 [soil metagenome]
MSTHEIRRNGVQAEQHGHSLKGAGISMETNQVSTLTESSNAVNGVLFGREPALWLAVVQAAIALTIGFGVNLSNDQFALLMGFAAAVAGLMVRTRVTPIPSVAQ